MNDAKKEPTPPDVLKKLQDTQKGWKHVLQPLDGGHWRIISTKTPSKGK